ncbi:MAG: type II toxin-antitoxin system HigB family toxin [Desulfomonilaceae bacterium]
MRIISMKKLREFWQHGHAEAEKPLRSWYEEAKKAVWQGPADIKARYQHASLLAKNRVVFNISGNKYRLVVWIRYDKQIVFIRFVGTHAEYDQIDAQEI